MGNKDIADLEDIADVKIPDIACVEKQRPSFS